MASEHLSEARYRRQARVTIIGAVINLLLSGAKIVIGVVARSNALVADGFHSLSDLLTDSAVLVGLRAARRPADESHSFGHGRFETVAALFVAVALLIAGGAITVNGVLTVVAGVGGADLPQPGAAALVAAAVSVVLKESMYHVTVRIGRQVGSPVMIANAWHQRSDAFSSVGALIGVGAAYVLGPQWRVLDSVAAIVVGLVIVFVGARTGLGSLLEMTDAALSGPECEQILSTIRAVPGVTDPHSLRTRRLGSTVAIEVHIRLDPRANVTQAHRTATIVEDQIRELYGTGTKVITHIEPEFRESGPVE